MELRIRGISWDLDADEAARFSDGRDLFLTLHGASSLLGRELPTLAADRAGVVVLESGDEIPIWARLRAGAGRDVLADITRRQPEQG